tara:strand:- start:155 stop:310 length:156 start_codon:yes stop_codon:yes gene_type:complete
MKVGDLVIGKCFEFRNHGVGVIFSKEFGGMKVYWPKKGVWCHTGTGGVKLL